MLWTLFFSSAPLPFLAGTAVVAPAPPWTRREKRGFLVPSVPRGAWCVVRGVVTAAAVVRRCGQVSRSWRAASRGPPGERDGVWTERHREGAELRKYESYIKPLSLQAHVHASHECPSDRLPASHLTRPNHGQSVGSWRRESAKHVRVGRIVNLFASRYPRPISSPTLSQVMDTKHTIDDMPEILQKLGSANKAEAVKTALGMLLDVASDEMAAQQVARAKSIVPRVVGWCTSKDMEQRKMAVTCCALLSQHECCAADIGSKEFLQTMMNLCKSKDKGLQKNVAQYFSMAGGNNLVRDRILEENIDEQVWLFVKSKDPAVMKLGIIAFSKIANDPEAATKLVAKDIEELVKFFFNRITKTDDTEVERWCLIAVARLALSTEFSEKLAMADKFPLIFNKANDNIASRKLAAALVIANLANNKNLRVKLVKHKAYQLFVEMAKVSSARKDMAEYQRVAALGLKNLSSNFDLRSLAAKVGALEAVVKMLRSRNIETARYAAKAASELSLHEENGRKMVLAGALKPLLEMAKSGDAMCENEAVMALANLALSEDNQKQFVKEGGMAAIEVMTVSRNPRVQAQAKRLLTRMRMSKMRAAARLAGKLATEKIEQQKKLEEGMYMSGSDSEEDDDEDD